MSLAGLQLPPVGGAEVKTLQPVCVCACLQVRVQRRLRRRRADLRGVRPLCAAPPWRLQPQRMY